MIGLLYLQSEGMLETATEHYDLAIKLMDQAGNFADAARARFDLAIALFMINQFKKAGSMPKLRGKSTKNYLFQVEGDMPGCMRTVNNGQDAQLAGVPADVFNRQDQGGEAGHMAEKEHACAWRNPSKQGLNDIVLGHHGQWDGMVDVARPGLVSGVVPDLVHRRVLLVGGQDFVTGLQVEAARTILTAVVGLGK